MGRETNKLRSTDAEKDWSSDRELTSNRWQTERQMDRQIYRHTKVNTQINRYTYMHITPDSNKQRDKQRDRQTDKDKTTAHNLDLINFLLL